MVKISKAVTAIFFLLAVLINISAVFAQNKRPNIIILLTDDQRADAIGACGNRYIHTPNMDKLAKEGFYFKNNYCAGSYSGGVCTASRAMLMTGTEWPHMMAKGGMEKFAFLPELLANSGYETFIVGKWHNGAPTLQRAFKTGNSIFLGGMNKHIATPLYDLADYKLINKRVDSVRFSSKIYADAAIDYLKNAPKNSPFFLYVAFTTPHDPRNPPLPYRTRYYKNPPPLPVNFEILHPFDNGFLFGRDESLAPWPRPKAMVQDQLSEYYGLVTDLDDQIGRIYAAIKNSPFADNTYIMFTSDNGLSLGSHGLLGKQNVYEEGMKTPLIIDGPGVPKGKSTQAFSYIYDLYSTCLHIAGVAVPESADARDLSKIWTGQQQKIRDYVFLPFQGLMRTVNDGRWKLHIYPPSNYVMLFDLKNDPGETKNIADNPGYKSTVDRLTKLIKNWQITAFDKQPLFVEKPKSAKADYQSDKFLNKNRILDPYQPDWIVKKYFNGVTVSPKFQDKD